MSQPVVGDVVVSLFGKPLTPPTPTSEQIANLATAQRNYAADPNLENTIWYGRRLAYCFQFAQAFAVYTDGITRFPTAHQLYRHRGHRYISTRQFDKALADFAQAAELASSQPVTLEPDGVPNRLNKPLSNTHFNIWYHWGLTHYLMGAYAQAVPIYQTCLLYSANDDSIVATSDWLYMTYRRLGDTSAAARVLAPIHAQLNVVENHAYHNRLLMYKGLVTPESLLHPQAETEAATELAVVTQGYGVGNWYLYNGQRDKAQDIFARVLQSQSWSAFGYIAAEVDMLKFGS
jgi:tetratricopeptide (TPR) repeat protein